MSKLRTNSNISKGRLVAESEPIPASELDYTGLLSYINDIIKIFNICLIYDKEKNAIFAIRISIVDSKVSTLCKLFKKDF